jgi:hypothetical protein
MTRKRLPNRSNLKDAGRASLGSLAGNHRVRRIALGSALVALGVFLAVLDFRALLFREEGEAIWPHVISILVWTWLLRDGAELLMTRQAR